MKITIITAHFQPELHPRAFRSTELALEFSKMGHQVEVVTFRTIIGFDYQNYAKLNNIKIKCLNIYKVNSIHENISDNKKLNKQSRFLIDYLIAGNLFNYSFKVKNIYNIPKNTDLVISISTPFMSLLSTALLRYKNKSPNTLFIADSGDPFYRSKQTLRAPYFYFIEKFVYRCFDYLTIPSLKSLPAYNNLITKNKIKIIPQGFNMDNVNLNKYQKNKVITFAYCGVFYTDIRNPKFLFDFLLTQKKEFRFYLFLRNSSNSFNNFLSNYKDILGDKITIQYSLNREDLLAKLSTMDFLINIENTTNTQVPSKLIDYAIADRPIYSSNSKNFKEEIFMDFLTRNYSKALKVNKEEFNIKNIASSFLSLVKEKNEK